MATKYDDLCACHHFGRFVPRVGQRAPARGAKGVAAFPLPYFLCIYNLFIIYEAIDFIKNQLSEPNEHVLGQLPKSKIKQLTCIQYVM